MSEHIRLVSIESPYNSLWPWIHWRNVQYAVLCNTHAASVGEATWVPHLCNTQYVWFGTRGFISDTLSSIVSTNRALSGGQHAYYVGREKTLQVTNKVRQSKVDAVVCYTDYGISGGMQSAIDAANQAGVPIEFRKLPQDLKKHVLGESMLSMVLPATNCGFFGMAAYGLLKAMRRGR